MNVRIVGLVVVTLLGSLVQQMRADEEKVRKIVERSGAAWRKVESLQCDFSAVRMVEKTDFSPEERRAGAYRLFIQGNQYREEFYDNLATPAGTPSSATGYNGTRSYHHFVDIGLLGIRTKAEMECMPPAPFTECFGWVIEPLQRRYWKELRDPATWEAAAQRGRYRGIVKDGDAEFELIEFDCTDPRFKKVVYRVYFNPKIEMFPIKTEVLDDGRIAKMITLDRHLSKKLSDELLIVPLEVTNRVVTEKGWGGKSRTEFVLAEDSLRLNAKLDEKLFAIPMEGVREIQDADKR